MLKHCSAVVASLQAGDSADHGASPTVGGQSLLHRSHTVERPAALRPAALRAPDTSQPQRQRTSVLEQLLKHGNSLLISLSVHLFIYSFICSFYHYLLCSYQRLFQVLRTC